MQKGILSPCLDSTLPLMKTYKGMLRQKGEKIMQKHKINKKEKNGGQEKEPWVASQVVRLLHL